MCVLGPARERIALDCNRGLNSHSVCIVLFNIVFLNFSIAVAAARKVTWPNRSEPKWGKIIKATKQNWTEQKGVNVGSDPQSRRRVCYRTGCKRGAHEWWHCNNLIVSVVVVVVVVQSHNYTKVRVADASKKKGEADVCNGWIWIWLRLASLYMQLPSSHSRRHFIVMHSGPINTTTSEWK